MAFDGRASAQFGVKIFGVYNMIWRGCTVLGFTDTQLYITSTNAPTSEITFSDLCFNSPVSVGKGLVIEYGTAYTTGLFFNNGTISGSGGTVLSLSSVNIDMSNTYISVNGDNAGVQFLTTGSYISGTNNHIDAASNASTRSVVILPSASTDGAHLVEAYLRGYFAINGLLKFSDAVTIDPFGTSYRLPYRSLMSYPMSIGSMTFLQALPTVDDSSVNPNTLPQIVPTSTSWNFNANAAVDIKLTPGTGKSVQIVGKFVVPSGATSARPTSPSTGTHYFDTTIGKPIWYNGTHWVDATGSSV